MTTAMVIRFEDITIVGGNIKLRMYVLFQGDNIEGGSLVDYVEADTTKTATPEEQLNNIQAAISSYASNHGFEILVDDTICQQFITI